VFKVFTKESYLVPEISDYLFFEHGLFTAEHDIPYQQRALVDLAATNDTWLFDSKGKKTTLNVLIYDIETIQYQEGSGQFNKDTAAKITESDNWTQNHIIVITSLLHP